MKTILSFCFSLVLVLAATTAQASDDDLVIYDDFKGSRIDPDKWEPRSIEAEALDVMRRVGGGHLRLRNTTYGNNTTVTDGTRNSTRVRLRFPDAVAANITEIKGKVELRRVQLIGCADEPMAANDSIVRARTGVTFFNDGSSPGPGDQTGDVFAQIQLLRLSDTADAPKVMRVVAVVDRCVDFNCNIDPIFFDDTTLGTVEAKSGKREAIIGIRWDPDNDRFIFQRDYKEVIYDYGPDCVVGGAVRACLGAVSEKAPVFEFADVEVRARIENCNIIAVPQERPVGHLKVFWDFVKVNKPAATLFGVAQIGGGPSTLVRINPLTGAATPVGPIGFNRISGMDYDASTGTMYAVGERPFDPTHVLITIDLTTGMGTEVGPTQIESFPAGGNGTMSDISFRSDGTLFGWNFPSLDSAAGLFGGLSTIDLATGTANLIAYSTGVLADDGSALAFSHYGKLLYAAGESPTGSTCRAGRGTPDCDDVLHRVDESTAAASLLTTMTFPPAPAGVINSSDPRPSAMDVNPVTGTLFASIKYGFSGNASEFLGTIDIHTGAVTLIGPTQRGLDAIAFVNPVEIP